MRHGSAAAVISGDQGRYVSFILHVGEGDGRAEFRGSVVRNDGQSIVLGEGSYLVRVWIEPSGVGVRGSIRRQDGSEVFHFRTGDRIGEYLHEEISRHM